MPLSKSSGAPIRRAICGRQLAQDEAFRETLISVDTFHSSVARWAVDAGAHIVNDVSGGTLDPDMHREVRLAARSCVRAGMGFSLRLRAGKTDSLSPAYNISMISDFPHQKSVPRPPSASNCVIEGLYETLDCVLFCLRSRCTCQTSDRVDLRIPWRRTRLLTEVQRHVL